MRHPNTLGGLTMLAIFGLTAALIIILPVNDGQSILLGLFGSFAGAFAGLAVAADRGRRIAGLDGPFDGGRSPKSLPTGDLAAMPNHIADNTITFQ